VGGNARRRKGTTMLVLTRHATERIYIGDEIVLTVIAVDRGKVRLGIEAPKDVPIARDDYRPKEVKP
jgi:carbon storage regulator